MVRGDKRSALRLSVPLIFIGGAILMINSFLAESQLLYLFFSPHGLVAFALGVISIFIASVLQVRAGRKIGLAATAIILGAISSSFTQWIQNPEDILENPFFVSSLFLFAGGALAWAWDV
jgi:hypothetical protein